MNAPRPFVNALAATVAPLVVLGFGLTGISASSGCGDAAVSTANAATCGAPGASAAGTDCMPKVMFIDTHGTAYPVESMAGHVVVVNFWATWCKPCKKEIPDFSRVADKYKDKGVMMFGVMTDQPDSDTLLNFMSDFEMTYPVIRADKEVLLAYEYPSAIPTTLVFDGRGKRTLLHSGTMSEAQLSAAVDEALASGKAPIAPPSAAPTKPH